MSSLEELIQELELPPTEDYYFPECMNTVEKYNDTIRKTNSVEKLQHLYMEFAEDPLLTAERILSLSQMMERDLILVHNKSVFSSFHKVVQSLIQLLKEEFNGNSM